MLEMTFDLAWIAALSSTCFLAVSFSALALSERLAPRAATALDSREAESRRALAALHLEGVTPRQVTVLTLLGALACGALAGAAGLGTPLAIVAGGAGLWLPRPLFAQLRARRRERFERSLPDLLVALGSAARAGLSVPQAIEWTRDRCEPPASQELGRISRELALAGDLGRTLEDARQRLASPGFDLFATALSIHRERGGDLPDALDRLAGALRESARLEERFVTASAEGRKAVWVVSAVPLGVALLVAGVDPALVATLFTSPEGLVVLVAALGFYASGLAWMRRLLRRDV